MTDISVKNSMASDIKTNIQKSYRTARQWVEKKIGPPEKYLLDVYENQDLPRLERLISSLKLRAYEERKTYIALSRLKKPTSDVWFQPKVLAAIGVAVGCGLAVIGATFLNAVFLGPQGIAFCLVAAMCLSVYVYARVQQARQAQQKIEQDRVNAYQRYDLMRTYLARSERERDLVLMEIKKCQRKLANMTQAGNAAPLQLVKKADTWMLATFVAAVWTYLCFLYGLPQTPEIASLLATVFIQQVAACLADMSVPNFRRHG